MCGLMAHATWKAHASPGWSQEAPHRGRLTTKEEAASERMPRLVATDEPSHRREAVELPVQELKNAQRREHYLDAIQRVAVPRRSKTKAEVPSISRAPRSRDSVSSPKVAALLAERHPEELTTAFRIALRKGRVFVDWLRNRGGATVVTPYSLRARARATVAAPIEWHELDATAPDAFMMGDVVGSSIDPTRSRSSPVRPRTRRRSWPPSTARSRRRAWSSRRSIASGRRLGRGAPRGFRSAGAVNDHS
jgi:hypothetical protein